MPQAQTILNEILLELIAKKKSESKYSELEAARVRRRIEQLTTLCEKSHALGVLNTIQGLKDEALAAFERAISSTLCDSVVYSNYWVTLNIFGIDLKAIDKGLQLARLSNSPKLYNSLLVWQMISLDMQRFREIMELLEKMQKTHDSDSVKESIEEYRLIRNFIERHKSELSEGQLREIGNIVFETSSKLNVQILGNEIEQSKQRSHLSISYSIAGDEYTPEVVSDLNFELADKLIERGLDSIPAVIKFKRVETSDNEEEMELASNGS